jgi:undecaprenyl-diphosphatase
MGIATIIVVVQLIIESLPISSSGHLALCKQFLHFFYSSTQLYVPPALEMITHVLNVAIIAIYFRTSWVPLFVRSVYSISTWRFVGIYRRFWVLIGTIVFYAFSAAVVTVVFYIFWHNSRTLIAFQLHDYAVFIGFCVTMFLLFSLRFVPEQKRYATLNLGMAILLGCVQGLALFPGVSRLASTYVVARWLQLRPRRASQTSFMIGVPVMLAGAVKDGIFAHDVPIAHFFSFNSLLILAVASLISYAALHLTVCLAYRHRLWWYGYYMILPLSLLFLLSFFTTNSVIMIK